MSGDTSTSLPEPVQQTLRRHASAIHYALRHLPPKATTPRDVLQRWEDGLKSAVQAISEIYPDHHANITILPKLVLGALYEYDYAGFVAEQGVPYVPNPWNVRAFGKEDPREEGFPFSYPISGDDDWKIGFVPLKDLQDGWVFEWKSGKETRDAAVLDSQLGCSGDDIKDAPPPSAAEQLEKRRRAKGKSVARSPQPSGSGGDDGSHVQDDVKRGRTPGRDGQAKRPARAQQLDYVSPPDTNKKRKRRGAESDGSSYQQFKTYYPLATLPQAKKSTRRHRIALGPDTLEFRDNGFIPYPVGAVTLDDTDVAPVRGSGMEPNDSNKPKGRLYNDSDDEEGFFETEEEWLEQLRKANEPQGENAGMEDIAQPPRPRKRARIRSPDVESEEDVEAESALPGPSVARYNIPSRVPGRDFFAIPESTLPSVDGHKRWEGRAASRPATMADLEAIRTEIANNSELVRRTLAQNQGLQEDVAALTARVLELEQVNHTLMTAPTLLSPFMFDATADFNEPPPSTPIL
ncbi:uncharacterized protein BXZ73DRAFT_84598 [Epithele typhae]|uniref:uncharacterized protein n=1 Tax=Epithele typhae TaxID=378194 RepID=UPI002008AE2C|nr:uncharacterized protein BXZ73DRAFT_84598 [Epithele typhae]KAH9907638.1 hypothetical protein BXZ73DRAFT_84598 [Epithele typhae]